MPSEWILSTQNPTPTFNVSVCDFAEEKAPTDIMARLEPFLGNANRRLDIFIELNNALTILQSLGNEPTQTNVLPVCYSFFYKTFSRHAEVAERDGEVSAVLTDLCARLKSLSSTQKETSGERRRPSIVDPNVPRMMGPRTTTSSRVDGRAKAPQTKMVDRFQKDVLNREKKPKRGSSRTHKCSVCLEEGHHQQTCQKLFAAENEERRMGFSYVLSKPGKLIDTSKFCQEEQPQSSWTESLHELRV